MQMNNAGLSQGDKPVSHKKSGNKKLSKNMLVNDVKQNTFPQHLNTKSGLETKNKQPESRVPD